MPQDNPNTKYYGEYTTESQISVRFFVNREGLKAAVLPDGNINEDLHEKLYPAASDVAKKIHDLCVERGVVENLPFLHKHDGDPENWFNPHVFCQYEGSQEEIDGVDLFDVTLAMEGGPFVYQDIVAFRDFVTSNMNQVAKETGATVELHDVNQWRKVSMNAVDTIKFD